ncbi:hypothetical protein [Kitasatospora sp. NBC_01539]|uniref:hypothetical protein n=1 Tax=Kitasatospora sp. NBC_01539 TaxID=2903577 RepID=UPI003860335C
MIFARWTPARSVEQLAAALAAGDGPRSERAFAALLKAAGRARPAELAAAGPALAGLLPSLPPEPRGLAAVLVGACVESGADPAACAGPVLTGLAGTLREAVRFSVLWSAVSSDDPPEFSFEEADGPGRADAATTALGGPEAPGVRAAVAARGTLDSWERAAVAVLAHPAGRAAVPDRAALLADVDALGGADRLRCLQYALLVLDDEPLVVLHRPTGRGFALRMSGVGDTFQLHTLLADVLINGGHLAGTGPTAQAAALCRTDNVAPERRPTTTGSFNLCGPDGTWIWNEGTPQDIPVVDGVRLLVLDPPPYVRHWPAGRFFPGMAADLVLERVLTPDEARARLDRTAPAERC